MILMLRFFWEKSSAFMHHFTQDRLVIFNFLDVKSLTKKSKQRKEENPKKNNNELLHFHFLFSLNIFTFLMQEKIRITQLIHVCRQT